MSAKLPLGGIDHVAITVADFERSLAFYKDVFGAEPLPPYRIDDKVVVQPMVAGRIMLNLHPKGNGVWLVAKEPTPGSVDICFRWTSRIEEAAAHLKEKNVEIIAGPITTYCSEGGKSRSVYFRDPDGNLLEFLTTIGVPEDAVIGT